MGKKWLPTDEEIISHGTLYADLAIVKRENKFTAKKIAERLKKSFATYTVATDDEDAYYTLLESNWRELLKEIEEN